MEKNEKIEKPFGEQNSVKNGSDHKPQDPKPHDPKPQDHKIKLILIVNGTPYEKIVNLNRKLQSVVEQILDETGNGGRPLSDWSVKFNDQDLDIRKTIEELKLPDGAELFLSLKAGIGGNQ